MRIAALVLFWTLLLYSCREVSYREPQPQGVQALKEIPQQLLGEYVGIDDEGKDTATLIVESWGYRFKDPGGKNWLGRGVISDSLVIKVYANYYFVNFRAQKDVWVLRVLKQRPSGDLEFMSINVNDDVKGKDMLKKLGKRFPVKEIKLNGDTFFQISPSKEQLVQLIKDGFFVKNDLDKVK
jgi:hypothetical protein